MELGTFCCLAFHRSPSPMGLLWTLAALLSTASGCHLDVNVEHALQQGVFSRAGQITGEFKPQVPTVSSE